MRKLCLLAAWLGVAAQTAGQGPVSIDEKSIRAGLRSGRTVISLPIRNDGQETFRGQLTVTWRPPDGKASPPVSTAVTIPPGTSTATIEAPLSESSVWLRLEYRLTPDLQKSRLFAPVLGVVSLSSIADYIFELTAASTGAARPGQEFSVQVQALQPRSRRPVQPEQWDATLSADGKQWKPVRSSALPDGFHEFVFAAPPVDGEDDFEESLAVTIRAANGDFERELEVEVRRFLAPSATIQTDKPIHQPGQTLRWRAVVSRSSGRAFADAEVSAQIRDEDGELVLARSLKASKFGVVHDEWMIPEGVETGYYRLILQLDEGGRELASRHLRISRYELPTFRVEVRPDKVAYLAGQHPTVEFRTNYLFGKPVPGASIRVIRRQDLRERTRKRQDKDEKKEVVAEGTAGEDGIARLAWRFQPEDYAAGEYERYRDLGFEAQITDPVSGRTEPKRFDLRTTRDAIHIYALGLDRFSHRIYVSTSYADGTPARTKVTIRSGDFEETAQTNRFGVAAMEQPSVRPSGWWTIEAVDSAGATGRERSRYWGWSKPTIRVSAAKTMHARGEAVRLKLAADVNPESRTVVVQAVVEGKSVARRTVTLSGLAGEVEFPYQPEFRRLVTFVAWSGESLEGKGSLAGVSERTVLFPDASDLLVTASTMRPEYRPGETANLQFLVREANGQPVRAALGVAVVDEAVIERARTEEAFGERSWFCCLFGRDSGEETFGGVSLNDLLSRNPRTKADAELDLVAEALASRVSVGLWTDDTYEQPLFREVSSWIARFQDLLQKHFLNTFEFPQDEEQLRKALGNEAASLRDPWEMPYRPEFSVEGSRYVVRMVSSGPDKQPGTEDDFDALTAKQPFFSVWEKQIALALRTAPEFPASVEQLHEFLNRSGIAIQNIRDPWGTAVRVTVETQGLTRVAVVTSAGPDKRFGQEDSDDVEVASFRGRYFQREADRIAVAVRNANPAPQTEEEFRKLLQGAGLSPDSMRDAWGREVRVSSVDSAAYSDQIQRRTVQVYGGAAQSREEVRPVTRRLRHFLLLSNGPDGIEGTYDDFEMARASVLLSEEAAKQPSGGPSLPARAGAPGTGKITGTVLDPSGAVIPRAQVNLFDSSGGNFQAETNEMGFFYFVGVPPGTYRIEVHSPGFQTYAVEQIPLEPRQSIAFEIVLQVGTVSEAVEVSASAVQLNTSSASVVTSQPTSTPRVRDYFPETLLWLPETITGSDGKALAEVKLADSITNWKIAVFASTEDGRMAESESTFRAFQPFFLDFQPPPVLTLGDEVELPVTVRNYTKAQQRVAARWQGKEELPLLGESARQATIAAGATQNFAFEVRASKATAGVRQTVEATAAKTGDAVARQIAIRPDGRELRNSWNDLLSGPTSHTLEIPSGSLPGTVAGEVIVYPRLDTVLWDSVRAMLAAPLGCAEQTISGAYGSLVALRFARASGMADELMEKQAKVQIQLAVDALPAFAGEGGGISYWGRGSANAALTAYAIQFLLGASAEVKVDRESISELIAWLQRSLLADKPVKPRSATQWSELALVLRALAAAQSAGFPVDQTALGRGFSELAPVVESDGDPYLMAQYLAAALDSKLASFHDDLPVRLASLAQQHRRGAFWAVRANTPFYGWGIVGQMETTAVVVSALQQWQARRGPAPALQNAIQLGLLYLIQSRDSAGWWYTTQSTVRTMEALTAVAKPGAASSTGRLELKCNGKPFRALTVNTGQRQFEPIRVDVSSCLAQGSNTLEFVPATDLPLTSVRVVSSYWAPWSSKPMDTPGELRYSITPDRLEAGRGEPIRYLIEAERVGFRGYGMMLATVGLPPGAEVDRTALQSALDDRSSGLQRYEVQPDRVLLYLWPTAGGARVPIWFAPRLRMKAKSVASSLYDYYNPEARVELPPVEWRIR